MGVIFYEEIYKQYELNQAASKLIDINNDGVVDGFLRYWDFSGKDGLTFKYTATSATSPWNEESTSIRVNRKY